MVPLDIPRNRDTLLGSDRLSPLARTDLEKWSSKQDPAYRPANPLLEPSRGKILKIQNPNSKLCVSVSLWQCYSLVFFRLRRTTPKTINPRIVKPEVINP